MSTIGILAKIKLGVDKDTKALSKQKINIENMFGKVTNIMGYVGALQQVGNKIEDLIGESSDYIENLNLLEVAFGDTAESAKNFADNLSKVYGLDESTLTKTLGIFRQIGNSLEMDSQYADKFSKALVEMQLDLSSLYNLSFDRAGSVLQSAISGQYRALKQATGADITNATLQTDLLNLGIERSVNELNRAERTLLIYNSLVRQLSESNGDLARTINAPANQMRIFQEQCHRLARAIGNVLMPVIGKILPYLNAMLMVLVELVNFLATFLGFNVSDYSNMSSGIEDVADGFYAAAGAADTASKSAENAKKSLRGFDKLNVISTPSSSGSSAGGGVGGGIDPKLLGVLDEYNEKMREINNKATAIRDKIMEWLGFAKNGNGEWEHTKWTWGDILLIAGGILITINTILKIWKLIKGVGSLGEMLGLNSALGLFKQISSFIGTSLLSPIKDIIFAIQAWIGGAATFSETIGVILSSLGTLAIVVGGIITTVAGIVRLVQGIVDLLNGDTFNGVLEIIEGIGLAVAGIALLFGAWPVAAIAAVVAIVAAVIQYWDKITEFFSKVGDWFNKNIVQPIKDKLSPIVSWIYEHVIQPVINFFKPILDTAVSIIAAIYRNVKEIVVGIINAVWSILSKIIEIGAKIVEILVALGIAFYTYVLSPIINWLGKAASWVYNNAIKPVLNFFGGIASWIYDNVIKPVWDKIIWIREKIYGIFKEVGIAIADFIGGAIKSVVNGVLSKIESGINVFIRGLNAAINLINKIPGVDIKKVSLLSIPRLANGGFVDEGQIFMAREAGPELVGTMDGKNAVANNEQITEGIRKAARDGFMDAMQYSGKQNVNVNITAEGDTSGLMNFITFKEKQKNRQYGL